MQRISIKKNIAYSSGSQLITMAASFVVNWFLARFLGPEKRGQYVYLFTLNTVIWMLLDLGVSKSMMYSLQHDEVDASKLYSYTLVFFGVALTISLGVFYFTGGLILGKQGYEHLLPLALGLGAYIVAYQMFIRQKNILIGLNHIREYALINLLPTLGFMLLLIPLFWLFPVHLRMEASYLLNVLSLLLIVLVFHFVLARRIKFHFIWDGALVIRSYALGFKAFLSEYLLILMTRMDMLILKYLGTFSQLGVYSLAINFLDMINIMANMIGIVLLNKFSALKDDDASLSILRKIFVVMLAFDLVCIGMMVLVGRPLIRILYGQQYLGAWQVFILLIPAIIGLTLGGLFNTFLWSKGFPVFTIIAPACTALLKAGLGFALIPGSGTAGAAISSSIAYVAWFLMLLSWYFSTHPEQKLQQLMIKKQDIRQLWDMTLALNPLGSTNKAR